MQERSTPDHLPRDPQALAMVDPAQSHSVFSLSSPFADLRIERWLIHQTGVAIAARQGLTPSGAYLHIQSCAPEGLQPMPLLRGTL